MKTRKKNITNWIIHILMFSLSIIILIPIYYLFVTTFKTGTEAALYPMALPKSWSLNGYIEGFIKMQYFRAFKNTFIITFSSVLGLLFVSSMCGYVLNRKSKYKIANFIFAIIMMGIMFPYQMSILGLYKLIRSLNLMNTLLAVILVNIAINIPFSTFLIKSFTSTVPLELEHAAKIDGANVFKTFFVITLPLMKPVLATIAILNTLTIWNDFMGPLYFLQSREKGVILQEVYRNIGQFSTDWSSLFPMMVLGVLPLLIFYLIMQKHIIGGVMSGAIKG